MMKTLFKIFLYFFLTVAFILIAGLIYLNFQYTRLDNYTTPDPMKQDATIYAGTAKNSGSENLNLIPLPAKVVFTGGSFTMRDQITFSCPEDATEDAAAFLARNLSRECKSVRSGALISFNRNNALPAQGYTLDIRQGAVNIGFSSPEGMWYAIVSLKVLDHNYKGKIPCVNIEDSPDLAVRGVMLDISRDKVPAPATLQHIAQLLSDLKYNHLELYIEGFSFAYPSFTDLWEGKETPVTGEEIRQLDAFCREHFINLVPNQNALGHMMQWLATDKYADLAECPDGYKLMGLIDIKGTLDPSDPRSLELVTRMTDDLLPNFSSSDFNVNLDEPFELGTGKNKKLAEEKGIGRIYLDYALKLHSMVKERGKNMLMWADIVLKHPELIPDIPRDITLLDWGYEASYPYEKHTKLLHDSGIKYMVCPGTNSWTSITGRTKNMLATISSAAINGTKNGAVGLLVTDWGDMGHWQYLPVSYAGYVAGAGLSWNSAGSDKMPLSRFLNSYVFCDPSGIMGELALELGDYQRFEEFPMVNMTTTMMAFQLGLRDKVIIDAFGNKMIKGLRELAGSISPESMDELERNYKQRHQYDFEGMKTFLANGEMALSKASPSCPDSTLVKAEYFNAIRLVRLGCDLKEFITKRNDLKIAEQREKLIALRDTCRAYLDENQRLWLERNKPGGYVRSTSSLVGLINQIDEQLKMTEKPALVRIVKKFFERGATAAIALYLGK